MTASLCGPACGTPLFLHVFGAMVLFGGLLTVATLSLAAGTVAPRSELLRRLAFFSTLVLVWPGWIAMRIGGQWVLSKENLDENTPDWVNVGYIVADAGLIVLLVLTILGRLAVRRPRAGTAHAALALVYLAALAVTWFVMSAKP